MTTKLRNAFRFFMKHGGYCTPPGKAACALQYARAEQLSRDEGLQFVWDFDYDCDDSWMTEKEKKQPHEWECCIVKNDAGDVLASLGEIVDADSDYRRVIEAELACEALAEQMNLEAAAVLSL